MMQDITTQAQDVTTQKKEKKINSSLRRARLSHLYSIKMAARQVGVSQTTYIRWEQGEQQPHLVNLQMLCDAFGLPPEELGYGHLVNEGEIVPHPRKPSR